MEPVVRKRRVACRLALRDFVGVMNGNMVDTTGVNIDGRP